MFRSEEGPLHTVPGNDGWSDSYTGWSRMWRKKVSLILDNQKVRHSRKMKEWLDKPERMEVFFYALCAGA